MTLGTVPAAMTTSMLNVMMRWVVQRVRKDAYKSITVAYTNGETDEKY